MIPQPGPNRRPLALRLLLRPSRPPLSVCPELPAWPREGVWLEHPPPNPAWPRSPLPLGRQLGAVAPGMADERTHGPSAVGAAQSGPVAAEPSTGGSQRGAVAMLAVPRASPRPGSALR